MRGRELLRLTGFRWMVWLGCAAFVPSGLLAQRTSSPDSADTAFVFLSTSLRHGLDTTVSPCTDFDQFVNGGWREMAKKDSAQQIWVFRDIYYRTQYLLADLLDSARTVAASTADADLRVLGYYHESCMTVDSLPRSLQALSMFQAKSQDTTRRLRCTRLAMHGLRDALGQAFVRKIIPPKTEQIARRMIDAIQQEILARVGRLPYLSADAKQRTLASLGYMTMKIMKPETTIDHTELTLSPTDLEGNHRAAARFVSTARMRQNDTVRRVAWSHQQYNPNAHFNPVTNSVEIPALLFQWPFFDANGDLGMGYAAAGVIIGHEIFHGVTHRLRLEDPKALNEQAKPLVKHYSSLPGMHVDGSRTLNENLADLGGMLAGYDAWARTARSSAAPLIEGFTPEQRFFLHYARIWRGNRAYNNGDLHSPGRARINGVMMNVPAFAKAFGCKEGDPMAKPASERATIW